MAPLRLKEAFHTPGRLHDFDHFAAFFAGALLLLIPARSWRSYFLRTVFLFAVGVFVEKLEVLVYHNPFEWHDVRTDSLGIGACLVLCALWPRGEETASRS
jgi:hypothetical protein